MTTSTSQTTVSEQKPTGVEATPATSGTTASVPVNGTPAVNAPVDAGFVKQFETLQSKVTQYEKDINNLKSFADKRVNELTVQSQERERQLTAEIEKLRINSLPPEERDQYLAELADREQDELLSRVSQADQIRAEYAESQKAIAYFLEKGVPISELVMDKGYESLYQSGFGYITSQYENLRKGSGVPPIPPQAPPVETGTGAVPSIGPKWPDLVAKYGTRENVYRLVEVGRLPASIIPLD